MRIAIEAKAKRESARVFTRVTKGARVGVLTGFEAKRDSRGRAIGISNRESQTRKNTKALLLKEIARQKLIASRESDLENKAPLFKQAVDIVQVKLCEYAIIPLEEYYNLN